MRLLAIALGSVLAIAACSERDDPDPDLLGAGAGGVNGGGASGQHCGYGGYTAGTDAGGIGGSEVPRGGTGGEFPVDAGTGGVDSGPPSQAQLDFEAFEACTVTPEVSASLGIDCNNQDTWFDKEAVRLLLEGLRDRTPAKYTVRVYDECIAQHRTTTHVFVVSSANGVSRATRTREQFDNEPATDAYSTSRCDLLDAAEYQTCLDMLEPGSWPENCAFHLFRNCIGAKVTCE